MRLHLLIIQIVFFANSLMVVQAAEKKRPSSTQPSAQSNFSKKLKTHCLNELAQDLLQAAQEGNLARVNALLAIPDINVNIRDENGESPLHWASWYGYLGIMAALARDPRTLINAQDADGYTPLHQAAVNKKNDALRFLLTIQNILVNLQAHNGNTVLHEAVASNSLTAVIILRQKNGIRLDIADQSGLTPLDHAQMHGYGAITLALTARALGVPLNFNLNIAE